MLDFSTIFKNISSIGILPEQSILDTIRRRILNIILFALMVLSGILIFYRLYLVDWDGIIVNAIVCSFSGFLLFLCSKNKHELALTLVSILIISLSVNLSRAGLHTSGIIYWALVPMGMALLFKKNLLKHLVFITCMLCFFQTTIVRDYEINIYITYIGATSIYYFAILSFVNFVERKEEEISVALKEKEKAIVDLKARNNNLQQFSYICSHDFKEPLRNIGGYSSLIQKKIADQQLNEQYEEYFEFIDSSVKTLSNITQTLKVFTEVNGREHLESEKIFIQDIFNYTSQNLSELIEEKNAELEFKNDSGKDFIYSSAYGLCLIFDNLIKNALKFNQSEQPKVIVSLEDKKDYLLLTFKDNGTGIEEQYLQYIFEPFNTLNNKNTSNSSGLGLAICKEISNKMGGEIWAESIVGEGSIFYVRLNNSNFNIDQ